MADKVQLVYKVDLSMIFNPNKIVTDDEMQKIGNEMVEMGLQCVKDVLNANGGDYKINTFTVWDGA